MWWPVADPHGKAESGMSLVSNCQCVLFLLKTVIESPWVSSTRTPIWDCCFFPQYLLISIGSHGSWCAGVD